MLCERIAFRHVCCFPSLYFLTELFRNDILILPSFKEHRDEYVLETFLLGWLNEVITVNVEEQAQCRSCSKEVFPPI